MILVDTSAWVEFFRGREPVAGYVAELLDENRVAVCGPVITELRRGLRSERDRARVLPLLDGCRWLDPPGDLWAAAGDLGYALGRRGMTVRTLDLLIAVHALSERIPLLTLDGDFALIRRAGFDLVLDSAPDT